MKVPEGSKHTYKDWLEWEGRWELIDGKPFNMTPTPNSEHQFIVGELFHEFRLLFGNKDCSVFVAPFDVYLSKDENYENPDHIIQPDISVICNTEQIVKKGCNGIPTLIVEVLSPSTALKDYNEKFQIYEQFGVKEYWIVDPFNQLIHCHGLNEGYFTQRKTFGKADCITSFVFKDLNIDLKNIFQSF